MPTAKTNKKISFSTLCAIDDKVSEYDWRPDDIFFSIEDIKKYIEPDLKAHFNVAVWLSQKEAKTQQEKETRRYLLTLINNYIEGGE